MQLGLFHDIILPLAQPTTNKLRIVINSERTYAMLGNEMLWNAAVCCHEARAVSEDLARRRWWCGSLLPRLSLQHGDPARRTASSVARSNRSSLAGQEIGVGLTKSSLMLLSRSTSISCPLRSCGFCTSASASRFENRSDAHKRVDAALTRVMRRRVQSSENC